jgi:hypothetical protein
MNYQASGLPGTKEIKQVENFIRDVIEVWAETRASCWYNINIQPFRSIYFVPKSCFVATHSFSYHLPGLCSPLTHYRPCVTLSLDLTTLYSLFLVHQHAHRGAPFLINIGRRDFSHLPLRGDFREWQGKVKQVGQPGARLFRVPSPASTSICTKVTLDRDRNQGALTRL